MAKQKVSDETPIDRSVIEKFVFNEKIEYLFWGVMTTLVYLVVRFVTMIIFKDNPFIPVAFAQVISVAFAFVVNKYFVFDGEKSQSLMVQLITFVAGRAGVALLDFFLTYIMIEKFYAFFINIMFLRKINYASPPFSSGLTKHLIGNPVLLNSFIVVFIIQILAIVINYIVSKYWAFK